MRIDILKYIAEKKYLHDSIYKVRRHKNYREKFRNNVKTEKI